MSEGGIRRGEERWVEKECIPSWVTLEVWSVPMLQASPTVLARRFPVLEMLVK